MVGRPIKGGSGAARVALPEDWRFGHVYDRTADGGLNLKLALIVVGLLVTTGIVYAACMFCP
jgi:hypothetical protein